MERMYQRCTLEGEECPEQHSSQILYEKLLVMQKLSNKNKTHKERIYNKIPVRKMLRQSRTLTADGEHICC